MEINIMLYYSIVALPFVLFFSRLLLTNFIVPYVKHKSLLTQNKQRSDWEVIKKKEMFLNTIFRKNYGKIISLMYRNKRFITNKEFIYGEINFLSFYSILEKAKPQPGEIFYDLGSGTGKAVISAALFYNFSKVYGIELLPPLHKKAIKHVEIANKLFKISTENEEKQIFNQLGSIQLINDSFLNCDFCDASIVYVAATCLTDTTWEKLILKMSALQPGSRIIVATKTIEHDKFEVIFQSVELMSWGLCPVNIYKIKE